MGLYPHTNLANLPGQVFGLGVLVPDAMSARGRMVAWVTVAVYKSS